jgi:microcystin-dependent protein
MDTPYLACIMPWAMSFAPKNWAFCNGQSLTIQQNQALFALISNRYGGDGKTTFNLPDLRNRFPRGSTNGNVATVAGSATITLNQTQIPAHAHTLGSTTVLPSNLMTAIAKNDSVSSTPAANTELAIAPSGITLYTAQAADTAIGGLSVTNDFTFNSAGGQAISLMPPSMTLNYIICISGYFPPRDEN